MSKEKSWDDIPSLDGLDIDWDFKAENPLGKRKYARMKRGELYAIFEVKAISVKVVTETFDFVGTLIDLSEGGIALGTKSELYEEQKVRVGFLLGEQKIISRAIVKQVERIKDGYRVGLNFDSLKHEYIQYIAEVYASQFLRP